MNIVRIWSKKHGAYWRHKSKGYTEDINQAGLFNRIDAEQINKSTHGINIIREIDEAKFLFEEIKALSWKQPFAELMFHNKIETRVWPTHYRGWVLICASKKEYSPEQVLAISGERQYKRIQEIADKTNVTAVNGYAIGLGKLEDCQYMNEEDEDRCFVRHHSDLYGHIYDKVQRIKPFPYKGSMKWGKVTQEQLSKIEFI